MLHNSSEFMPYVIFIAAPGVEVMKSLYDYSRNLGYSTRTLTVSRKSVGKSKKCYTFSHI